MGIEYVTDTCNRCSKCKGLLIPDIFLCDNYWISAIRCINCGNVKLDEKAIINANQTKDKRTHKLDELQLYRTRRRDTKRSSNNLQY